MSIAGSDSGGGAGIQADLKTISALGGYGITVVTAITSQNTTGIQAIHPVPQEHIASQLHSLLDDFTPGAIKTGMLYSPETAKTVAQILSSRAAKIPLIIDPMGKAKDGTPLGTASLFDSYKDHLFPLASVITPNLDEAELLTGTTISAIDDMKKAAQLLQVHQQIIVIKGGHLENSEAIDIVYDGKEFASLSSPRIDTKDSHGTGCTFASAVASYIARGNTVREAIKQAKAFITSAIEHSLRTGRGSGPVNQFFNRENDER